ncbi:hypothetical protein FB446DRAFT_709884, partial [Lentinula raphanica]
FTCQRALNASPSQANLQTGPHISSPAEWLSWAKANERLDEEWMAQYLRLGRAQDAEGLFTVYIKEQVSVVEDASYPTILRSALGAYGYVIPSSAHTCWTELNDDQLTVNNVQDVLKAISDDVWVSAACTDRLVDDLFSRLFEVSLRIFGDLWGSLRSFEEHWAL